MARAQTLPFTNYNTANGLTHNRTHVIKQDGKGYIWIGTDLGINRYDGRTFKHFPCPGHPYRAARNATRYGNTLIFSVDFFGIAVCCGDSVRFIELKTDRAASISGAVVANDSTYYIVSGGKRLYRLENGIAERIKIPKEITIENYFTDIFKDRNSNVWLLSAKGLIYFKGGDVVHPLVVPFFANKYINVVRQDRNGDLYIAGHFGVYKYTEADCKGGFVTAPELIMSPGPEVTSLTFDAGGSVWMSSTYNGIFKYNKINRKVNNYGVANGLVSQNTWDIFCDAENNIWVTSENGLSKLTTQYYSSFNFNTTDYQNVKSAIVWNDSTLIFSNQLNAYTYINGKINQIKEYKSVPEFQEELFLKMPDGKLMSNVNVLTNSVDFKTTTYLYNYSNNSIVNGQDVAVPEKGGGNVYLYHGSVQYSSDMWVSSSKGLQLYRNGKFYTASTLTHKGEAIYISFIAADNTGGLWLINNYKDLIHYRITPATAGSFPYTIQEDQYISFKQLDSFRYFKVFVDSRGYVWLTSRESGVCRITVNKDNHVTRMSKFGTDKFSSGVITDIIEDKDHNLWVGTAAGLDKMTFYDTTFTIEKDLYGVELCGKFIYFIRQLKDKLFVGTSGCMGVIDLELHEPKVAPKVYISGIKINEHWRGHGAGSTAELQSDENIVSFTFTGISYKDERNIKYSYKLEGIDKSWSEATREYTVTYSRLPPGSYTLQVKALSSVGVWSQPAVFSFVIAQPFYTRWWFMLLVVLVVFAIIYSVYRYRIDQLMKIQRIRQSISKDLHDDIGATVSSINILANMAKSDLVSEHKRNQFLETIQEESKHVSESLNDIVWSINPKNDSLEIMIARMQRYASELFEAKNIAYSFDLPELEIDELTMDMGKRQHVYLIFKEAVNNLVKYSQATTATVTVSVSKTEFYIVISDNGRGFDVNSNDKGNGLFNMRKRAEELNADLEIDSAGNKGTTIALRMPI